MDESGLGVAYFDTNVLSELAKNPSLTAPLRKFLNSQGLVLGLGEAQVAELSDASRLHLDLVNVLNNLPLGLLKGFEQIISEEVASHPNSRTQPPFSVRLPSGVTTQELLGTIFSSQKLRESRAIQRQFAERMPERIVQGRADYPPKQRTGYTKAEADIYSLIITMQWLKQLHPSFLLRYQRNASDLKTEVFLSTRLFAYVTFYKYYLNQRDVKRLSDFGDMAHLFPMPYCRLVVTERDLCNILNQIKGNTDILENTEIHNLRYLRDSLDSLS